MYNGDLKWADLATLAGAASEVLDNALLHGKKAYDEWQSFRAGRSNADIASALTALESPARTISAAMVAELDACYAALKELHDAQNNIAVAQLDRAFAMRKFS